MVLLVLEFVAVAADDNVDDDDEEAVSLLCFVLVVATCSEELLLLLDDVDDEGPAESLLFLSDFGDSSLILFVCDELLFESFSR